jgi:hypothetical protein
MQTTAALVLAGVLCAPAAAAAQDWEDDDDDQLFSDADERLEVEGFDGDNGRRVAVRRVVDRDGRRGKVRGGGELEERARVRLGVERDPWDDDADGGREFEERVEIESFAAGKRGDFGFGLSSLLVGAVGAEAEYYYGSSLMFTGNFGFEAFAPTVQGTTGATVATLAAAVFYRLAGDNTTVLFAGGRLDLGYGHADPAAGGAPAVQFGLELPMRVQLYLNRNVAVHVEGGLVFRQLPAGGGVFGDPSLANGNVIALGGHLLGGAGVTLYLD